MVQVLKKSVLNPLKAIKVKANTWNKAWKTTHTFQDLRAHTICITLHLCPTIGLAHDYRLPNSTVNPLPLYHYHYVSLAPLQLWVYQDGTFSSPF